MILSNTVLGNVGIFAAVGDSPVLAAVIAGVFTIANTVIARRWRRGDDE
ncbi:MAG TPA: hypothetical protein VN962_26855 [Polyangia bacterium]|nr:hypothetical protein [Polyangia bacterium]